MVLPAAGRKVLIVSIRSTGALTLHHGIARKLVVHPEHALFPVKELILGAQVRQPFAIRAVIVRPTTATEIVLVVAIRFSSTSFIRDGTLKSTGSHTVPSVEHFPLGTPENRLLAVVAEEVASTLGTWYCVESIVLSIAVLRGSWIDAVLSRLIVEAILLCLATLIPHVEVLTRSTFKVSQRLSRGALDVEATPQTCIHVKPIRLPHANVERLRHVLLDELCPGETGHGGGGLNAIWAVVQLTGNALLRECIEGALISAAQLLHEMSIGTV